MKTVDTYIEKKSIFRKLLDAVKNTALYSMFFDDNSSIAIDSDTNKETKIDYLSQNSGLSKDEVKAINEAFGKADSNMAKLTSFISSNNNDKNPFKVSPDKLNHTSKEIIQEESQRASKSGISREDDL